MAYENLAEHYIAALEAYGIDVPRDAEGTPVLFDEDGMVAAPVRKQIAFCDAEDIMPRKLLQDAALQGLDYAKQHDAIARVKALCAYHERVFNCRYELWSTMVAAYCSGREFTDVELTVLESQVSRANKDLRAAISNEEPEIAERARSLADARQIKKFGLLFDPEMIDDVDTLVGNAISSRPTLIVGDKGVAKTQLARFVMGLFPKTGTVVSVKGDMASAELIGRRVQDEKTGIERFEEGPVVAAMRTGAPVLLDEINYGDQQIIARLSDVLLSHTGDTVYLQESDEYVKVAPGFAVFATANEASRRYRHREILDPAMRDRFEILERSYPGVQYVPQKKENEALLRLALCACIDEDGIYSRHIDRRFLLIMVRLATITERLYALAAGQLEKDYLQQLMGAGFEAFDEPLLTDCITPRALNRALTDSAGGNLPGRHLDLYTIDKIVRALDQAGTQRNAPLVKKAAALEGIDLAHNR